VQDQASSRSSRRADVNGLALGPCAIWLRQLVPVGHPRSHRLPAHGGQQRELGHADGHRVVAGRVAEAAAMPQQELSISSGLAPGIRRSTSMIASTAPKAFWWSGHQQDRGVGRRQLNPNRPA